MDHMDGTILDELPDHEHLTQMVLEELLALRSKPGRLTIHKFSERPTLRLVCGGGDLLDAFLMFQRELTRLREDNDRNLAAAAWSISAEADSVLDRLQLTAEALSGEEWRDQRSARRWSDQGMHLLADQLAYSAEVQGRLGQELLSIELHDGSDETRLHVVIDQMVSAHLPATAPLVRLWHYPDGDDPQEADLDIDLEAHGSRTATKGGQTMRRHRLDVPLPDACGLEPGQKAFNLSVEGRDAPMRTVFFADYSTSRNDTQVRFAAYRTIAKIDLEAVDGISRDTGKTLQ